MPDKKTLLCVDDDISVLTLRKLMLERVGYRVITADSGATAAQRLASGAAVDLVVLDYLMPGMNGDELAALLRRNYPLLPLLVISAVPQLPQHLIEMVDAHLQKGVDPELLLSTISRLLPSDRTPVPDEPHHGKSILCIEDEQLQLKVRTILFEAAGYRVYQAQSADTAMEIFRSKQVDAVVMDYWLSGQNGMSVAQEMKRLRPHTPIVMLSGWTSLPGEVGLVDSWLRKADTEPGDLINEVNRLIELRSSHQRAQSS